MPETTEPQLTESEVSEIEQAQIERRKSAEYQRLPVPPFVEDIDALIRDWRALRAANEWQKSSIEHFTRAVAGSAERLVQAERDIAALREQLDAMKKVLVTAAIPYEAILLDAESRRWIAPKVWQAIESAVVEIRRTVKESKP